MAEKPKKLVLIDAHAILHRAYHALPEFSNSKGEPTGGLYGLATMLIKIIADLKPDYLAAAYDLPKPTFRHESYKDYKAGRAKADDALISQMKRSRELFEAMGIPIYDKEGFEADDILGTIVEIIKNQETITKQESVDSIQIVIASGDMDTLQLVNDKRVMVYTLKKGITDTVLYDEEAVKLRYGFPPALLPDFKGLTGDPSDNIKGVSGIGDKTATELVATFGSIEEIYQELSTKDSKLKTAVKPRVVELLEKGKEDAEFSKILATIRRDAPIVFSLPEKPWRESVHFARAEKLFTELEFRTLADRFRKVIAENGASEKTGAGKTAEKKIELVHVQASLNDAFSASGIPPEELAETAVALWLINSNLTNPTLDDVLGFAGTRDWKKARERVFAELKKRTLAKVFSEIEQPLIPVVLRMNERGVAIDVLYLATLSAEYHKELASRERDIWKAAGEEFNINSPKQLGDVLFNKLGLQAARQKKTAGGAPSTRESELLKMRELHPVIGKILEYREFQKLLSTYIDNIPAMVASNGRLHATFLQAGTTTGRMSSQNPNLQNIPIQTPLGRRIRNAIIAAPGFELLSFDYSQMELRIAAMLSGDRKLIEIFKEGRDVHSAVASEVFNVSLAEVTKEMRRRAKVINFGMLYGMGVNSLRQALSEGDSAVTREEAQSYFDKYFADFRELAAYLDEVRTFAYQNGYTETLFGRRRYHEAIRSPIPYIRAAAERAAVNAPIQGTLADLIKLAMVRVDEFVRKETLEQDVFLILQVHDELVYEVREPLVGKLAGKIKEIMEAELPGKTSRGVPIVVDIARGRDWGSMKKLS